MSPRNRPDGFGRLRRHRAKRIGNAPRLRHARQGGFGPRPESGPDMPTGATPHGHGVIPPQETRVVRSGAIGPRQDGGAETTPAPAPPDCAA